MSIRTVLLSMAACVVLIGCSTVIDPYVGRGPIELTSDAEQAFADYGARSKPRYFAVSTDGRAYYYSFCDDSRCLRQAKTNVISKYESFSDGVPCKIYGSQGKVVWSDES